MTNKDKYIAELRAQHPEMPQEFFDFCAAIPDYDKAMHYADLLHLCRHRPKGHPSHVHQW